MERIPLLRAALTVMCSSILLNMQTASAQTLTTHTVISPSQAGTTTTIHGKSTIALSKEVTEKLANTADDPSYYVVLTPIGNNARLSLSDINDHSFTINASDADRQADALVQYVVFVKQNITAPDRHTASGAPHSVKPIIVGK